MKYEIIGGKCIIPAGVEEIEEGAFKECTNLIEITLPNSIHYIGVNAFEGCTSLKRIQLPQNVYMDCGVFKGCTSLESISIPEGVKEIDRSLFKNCSSLKEIDIPEGVTVIRKWAFSECKSLSRVSLPKTLESFEMEEETFNYCDLDEITIHPSNKYYSVKGNCLLSKDGLTLFRGCNNSVIPNGVTRISNFAFSGCTQLVGIVIPDSVKIIGMNAFDGCTSLSSILIPPTVEEICGSAFLGCTSLTNITIDTTRTTFDMNSTFRGCPNAITDGLYSGVHEQRFVIFNN